MNLFRLFTDRYGDMLDEQYEENKGHNCFGNISTGSKADKKQKAKRLRVKQARKKNRK